MASSTASTTTPSRHEFRSRVAEVKPRKSDINDLILDYLTNEGYSAAAAKFSKEANLRPRQSDEAVRGRQNITRAIHLGHIQEAIDALNEFEPSVLDRNPSTHFALLRLQLVELIRSCQATPGSDIAPVLDFATTHLAPRAPTNPQFLEDLERTMALLIFPAESLEPQLAEILHPNLRRDVADEVNKILLLQQNQRRDSAIRNLVRLRTWAEEKARDTKKDIPAHLGLGLDPDNNDNGHEPMII